MPTTLKKAPDLKAPSTGLPEWVMWIIGSVVVLGCVASVAYLYKDKNAEDQHRIAIQQRGFPAGFFAINDEKDATDEVVIHDIAVPDEPPKEAKKPKRRARNTAPRANSKHERFTAAQLFDQTEMNKALAVEQYIAQLNAERMGSAAVMVNLGSEQQAQFKKVDYQNTQPVWDEPQDIASYPVELDRVWTVDKTASCILIEEIISDIEGKVRCQIEENLYGAHGRHVLIPAGSKAVGRYKPLKKVGDERLTIRWQRIITPDGINIHTGDAEMTDGMGRSGATGDVDRRYTERYGMALLFSSLSAIAAYSIPVENANQQIIIENYSRDILTLTNTILQEHINIKPRVTIPAGSRISISASRDVWFKEVKEKQLDVVAFK